MKIPRNEDRSKHIRLIALDIRSSENVGSFFRTSDALGIEHVYLVGYTPTPLDMFNRPDSKIAKTALGAETSVPSSHHKTIGPLIKKLKKEGFTILALEQDPASLDYREDFSKKTSKIALILGNEVTGVPKSTLKTVDYIVEIPMRGTKESLNVSVAAGIALSELTRLW